MHKKIQVNDKYKGFDIHGSGHMKDLSGLVGSAFTSPNGLVEKKVSVKPWADFWRVTKKEKETWEIIVIIFLGI